MLSSEARKALLEAVSIIMGPGLDPNTVSVLDPGGGFTNGAPDQTDGRDAYIADFYKELFVEAIAACGDLEADCRVLARTTDHRYVEALDQIRKLGQEKVEIVTKFTEVRDDAVEWSTRFYKLEHTLSRIKLLVADLQEQNNVSTTKLATMVDKILNSD